MGRYKPSGAVQALLLLPLVLLPSACGDLVTDFEYSSITVEALRRTGEPVPGVEFALFTGNRVMEYGTTDESGRYTFEFVPFGNYGISSSLPPDLRSRDLQRFVVVDDVEVGHSESSTVEFVLLKEGPGAVEVTVVDESGAPLPGTEVTIYGPDGDIETAESDAQGLVRFDPVPFGNYGVFAVAPEGFIGSESGPRDFVDGIIVDEGFVADASFEFRPCRGDIVVRVRDENGAPAEGVRLTLYTATGVAAVGETGAGGAHVFEDLACGGYGVRLERSPGYSFGSGRGVGFVDALDIEENGAELNVDLQATTCSGVVRIRVVDTAGDPVAGARLVLYGPGEEFGERVTGAAGLAEFEDAPCGSLGVRLEPPEGFTAPPGRGGSFIDGIEMESGETHEGSFTVSRE